jgi:hypothetical protein
MGDVSCELDVHRLGVEAVDRREHQMVIVEPMTS